MNKRLILGATLTLSLLTACSDDKDLQEKQSVDPIEQTEQPAETPETPEQPVEQTISDDDLQQLLTAVKDKAFSSLQHEGSVLLEETYMKGGERADFMKHSISYRQNDDIEGIYGENQLYYKKHFEHEGDEFGVPTGYEGYIQPDKAMYRYNDDAGWAGYDLMDMGEIGLERMSFLSPADFLSMLEMNEDSLFTKIVSDEFVTVSFEPLQEDQTSLLYNVLEADSFYHQQTTPLQFDTFEVNLILARDDNSLSAVTVYFKQTNIDNEKEYVEVSYNQQFTATELTEEIRPPSAVFAEAGLDIWD